MSTRARGLLAVEFDFSRRVLVQKLEELGIAPKYAQTAAEHVDPSLPDAVELCFAWMDEHPPHTDENAEEEEDKVEEEEDEGDVSRASAFEQQITALQKLVLSYQNRFLSLKRRSRSRGSRSSLGSRDGGEVSDELQDDESPCLSIPDVADSRSHKRTWSHEEAMMKLKELYARIHEQKQQRQEQEQQSSVLSRLCVKVVRCKHMANKLGRNCFLRAELEGRAQLQEFQSEALNDPDFEAQFDFSLLREQRTHAAVTLSVHDKDSDGFVGSMSLVVSVSEKPQEMWKSLATIQPSVYEAFRKTASAKKPPRVLLRVQAF